MYYGSFGIPADPSKLSVFSVQRHFVLVGRRLVTWLVVFSNVLSLGKVWILRFNHFGVSTLIVVYHMLQIPNTTFSIPYVHSNK